MDGWGVMLPTMLEVVDCDVEFFFHYYYYIERKDSLDFSSLGNNNEKSCGLCTCADTDRRARLVQFFFLKPD